MGLNAAGTLPPEDAVPVTSNLSRLIAVPCGQLWLPRAHRGDIYDPCQWVLETFLTIGERLREQRLALGYSQTDFAALVGASKKTQGRWELGESSPGAEALAGYSAELRCELGVPDEGL